MISLFTMFAAACEPKGSFFGFPTWYKYLPGVSNTDESSGITTCTPKIEHINDAWLIAAAVIDLLLRIAALGAIVFVIYGGINYIMSQGEPDKAKQARGTIINSLIGLVISVAAASIISFLVGRFN